MSVLTGVSRHLLCATIHLPVLSRRSSGAGRGTACSFLCPLCPSVCQTRQELFRLRCRAYSFRRTALWRPLSRVTDNKLGRRDTHACAPSYLSETRFCLQPAPSQHPAFVSHLCGKKWQRRWSPPSARSPLCTGQCTRSHRSPFPRDDSTELPRTLNTEPTRACPATRGELRPIPEPSGAAVAPRGDGSSGHTLPVVCPLRLPFF